MQTGTEKSVETLKIDPGVDNLRAEWLHFARSVIEITADLQADERLEQIADLRDAHLRLGGLMDDDRVRFMLAASLLLDLIAQGRRATIRSEQIQVEMPAEGEHADKDEVRNSHLAGRDAQLREPAVRQFIESMQRPRLFKGKWQSIFTLMRDGESLADELSRVLSEASDQDRLNALRATIEPYLEFVDSEKTCKFTGLRLIDIWRYFRHTWATEYKSVPGRMMMILVRDAAAENHPVIGIAALGSSVVQHQKRDAWIGWRSDVFIEDLKKNPSEKMAKLLEDGIGRLIGDIWTGDLEDVCDAEDLSHPTPRIIRTLTEEADVSIVRHRENPQKNRHKGAGENDESRHRLQSESSLFRGKRCRQLARLLSIRSAFQDSGFKSNNYEVLPELLTKPRFRDAVAQLVRMIKAEHVGIDMMDITVCGAIQPYSAVLGGKLVSMLLCSPEVYAQYNERYAQQVSVIASGMKGEPVVRSPRLSLLCTTSLYPSNASQYNRIRIPVSEVGGVGGDQLRYQDIGRSRGYGTYHLSPETIRIAEILNARSKGQRVNSIFGEGVNPLMRKLRDSIATLDIDPDRLLRHGNERVTYGISIARNFREVLLGIEEPEYFLPASLGSQGSRLISRYWMKRWCLNRLARPEVIEDVRANKLTIPRTHGAIVTLPSK